MNDPYASEAETKALLQRDTRTPAEKKLDQMLDERWANEQGVDAVGVLRQIAIELIAQQAEAVPLLSDAKLCAIGVAHGRATEVDGYEFNTLWFDCDLRADYRAVEQAVRAKMGVAVPMTPKDYAAAIDAAVDEDSVDGDVDMWAFIAGIKAAERYHGIVSKEGA